jgi:hypothetical protein
LAQDHGQRFLDLGVLIWFLKIKCAAMSSCVNLRILGLTSYSFTSFRPGISGSDADDDDAALAATVTTDQQRQQQL